MKKCCQDGLSCVVVGRGGVCSPSSALAVAFRLRSSVNPSLVRGPYFRKDHFSKKRPVGFYDFQRSRSPERAGSVFSRPSDGSSRLPIMASAAALNVAAVGACSQALLDLEGMLATFDMARGPLLHLLSMMTGIVHVLVAELALHCSLLLDMNGRPTWRRSRGYEIGST